MAKEKHLYNQILSSQMSGHGPLSWTMRYLPALMAREIPAVVKRYANEIRRILGVLEIILSANPENAQWLWVTR